MAPIINLKQNTYPQSKINSTEVNREPIRTNILDDPQYIHFDVPKLLQIKPQLYKIREFLQSLFQAYNKDSTLRQMFVSWLQVVNFLAFNFGLKNLGSQLLPVSADKLFRCALCSIPPKERNWGSWIFEILLHSLRLLSLLEFHILYLLQHSNFSLELDHSSELEFESRLKNVLGGVVTIRRGKVYLVHLCL